MDKKISVAIATYKGAKYLQPLLDCLARQTYLPYEVIVSDDNSPDETVAIVEAFAETAPFTVKVIRNTAQLGVIDNFATAFEHCSGDLIAYCDQDDIWDKTKLEKAVKYFTNPEVKLVMHCSQVVDSNLNPLGYQIPEKSVVEFGQVEFPSTYDMSYGLGHQMLFDAKMYKDFAWIFRQGHAALQSIADNYDVQIPFIAGMNGNIISLEDALVKFRRHETATSDAGAVDAATATTAGFLSKSCDMFYEEGDKLASIASTLDQHIIPSMEKYQDTLAPYIRFVKKRAEMYRLRGKIYDRGHLFGRIGIWLSLLFKGAYAKKGEKGFGRKAFAVDLFVSVLGLNGAKKIIALKS